MESILYMPSARDIFYSRRRFFLFNALAEHIFNENAVSRAGIVNKNVRHRANELAVLNDGAATHTLNDAARSVNQSLIGDFYAEALVSVRVAIDA